MKSIILIVTIILSMSFFTQATAQCDSNSLSDLSIAQIPEDFTFLKTFKIDGQGGAKEKIEYSYVFSKDTDYSINIKADGESTDGIMVSLYDSKRNQVATNFVDGNFYAAIDYPCHSTGIYYITFTFQNSTNYCGGCALAFKR